MHETQPTSPLSGKETPRVNERSEVEAHQSYLEFLIELRGKAARVFSSSELIQPFIDSRNNLTRYRLRQFQNSAITAPYCKELEELINFEKEDILIPSPEDVIVLIDQQLLAVIKASPHRQIFQNDR